MKYTAKSWKANAGIFVGHPSWTSCGYSLDEYSYLTDSELVWLHRDYADLLEAVWPMKIPCQKVDSFYCLLNTKTASPDGRVCRFWGWECTAVLTDFQLFYCIIPKSKMIMLHICAHVWTFKLVVDVQNNTCWLSEREKRKKLFNLYFFFLYFNFSTEIRKSILLLYKENQN